MWKRRQAVIRAIVRELKARKVSCSHWLWNELGSLCSDPEVIQCLRHNLTERVFDLENSLTSFEAQRAYLSIARAFLLQQIQLSQAELAAYCKQLKTRFDQTKEEPLQELLAAFGEPAALDTAFYRLRENKEIYPYSLLALFYWRPEQRAKCLQWLFDRANRRIMELELLGYLRHAPSVEIKRHVQDYLVYQMKARTSDPKRTADILLSVALKFGDSLRRHPTFQQFLLQQARRARQQISRIEQESDSLVIELNKHLDVLVYYCLLRGSPATVRAFFSKTSVEPLEVAQTMLSACLGDSLARHRWIEKLQSCHSSLRWMREILLPMFNWYADLLDTKRLDRWLDQQAVAVKHAVDISNTAQWLVPIAVGNQVWHISASRLLLQYWIMVEPRDGVRLWFRQGVPDKDAKNGSEFFWELSYFL